MPQQTVVTAGKIALALGIIASEDERNDISNVYPYSGEKCIIRYSERSSVFVDDKTLCENQFIVCAFKTENKTYAVWELTVQEFKNLMKPVNSKKKQTNQITFQQCEDVGKFLNKVSI